VQIQREAGGNPTDSAGQAELLLLAKYSSQTRRPWPIMSHWPLIGHWPRAPGRQAPPALGPSAPRPLGPSAPLGEQPGGSTS
jgi:hypothetical protein